MGDFDELGLLLASCFLLLASCFFLLSGWRDQREMDAAKEERSCCAAGLIRRIGSGQSLRRKAEIGVDQ